MVNHELLFFKQLNGHPWK